MANRRSGRSEGRKIDKNRRLRAAYRAAMQFLEREPWLELDNEDYLVFELDDVPGDHVALVMGAAGQEFGLMVSRGPRAEELVRQLLEHGDHDGSLVEGIDLLSLYVDRANLLPPEQQSELKRAKIKAKGATLVPYFMAKRPYHVGGLTSATDRRILHTLLHALMIAGDRGWFAPGQDPRPRIRVIGDPLVPAGQAGALELELLDDSIPTATSAHHDEELDVVPHPAWTTDATELAELTSNEETWQVLMVSLPGRIEGSPELLRALLVFEPESELILDMHVVSGSRGAAHGADRLLEVVQGNGATQRVGLPQALEVFDHELLALVAPVFEPAGVACRYVTRLSPALEELVNGLRDHMAHAGGGEAPGAAAGHGRDHEGLADDTWSGDPSELAQMEGRSIVDLPSDDDAVAWKAVEHRLIRRAMRATDHYGAGIKRLTARYFGGADARDRVFWLLEDSPELPIPMVFQEWLWLDYRKNNREPTLAEQMLAGEARTPLPHSERVVLESLSAAPLSLQRVVSIQDDQRLVLEDVLQGGQRVVTDGSLASSARPDQVFPARVFPVGDFHFVSGAGLVIPPMLVSRALDQLRDWGLKTTPAALRRGAHLFGRLWEFVHDQPKMPLLQNTDGEELVLHEATFGVPSTEAATAALRGHPDFDHDPDSGHYVWLEPRPGKAVSPVVMGRFRLEGDQLLFSTNSARRWQRAQAWVERALPDAELEDLERQEAGSVEQVMATAPHGDRGTAVPPTEPDLSAADFGSIRDHVRQMMLRWVDEKIPMLGGRTPREAVGTPDGRRQVQQLLRTYSPSQGPGGMVIDPPLAEMRRELGLPAEDGDESADTQKPAEGSGRSGMFAARKKRKQARSREKKARRDKRKKKRKKK